jgi:tetratricopeptide (TPR) repeat protein
MTLKTVFSFVIATLLIFSSGGLSAYQSGAEESGTDEKEIENFATTAIELSDIHRKNGDFHKAVNILRTTLKEIELKKNFEKLEVAIEVRLANLLWQTGDNNEAYFLLNRAKDIAEELQDDTLLKDVYYHLGEIYYIEAGYMVKQNFDTALEYHNKALELREKVGDKEGIVDSYARIGTIYERQGQRDEALEYQKKGLELATEIGYEKGLSRPLVHHGSYDWDKGDFKTALRYFREDLELCRRLDWKRDLVFALVNVASALVRIDESNLAEAIGLCEEALKIVRKLDFKLALVRTLSVKGELHLKHGQDKEALECFLDARDIAAKSGFEVFRKSIEKNIVSMKR